MKSETNKIKENAQRMIWHIKSQIPADFKPFEGIVQIRILFAFPPIKSLPKNIIDKIIEKYLHNWTLDRMALVDKNILRLATFELLVFLETPVNVIINEAIEIAKEYSTKDSGRFVNGLLDQIKNVRTDTELLKRLKNTQIISNYDNLQNKF